MQRVSLTLIAVLVLGACTPKVQTPPPPTVAVREVQPSPDRLKQSAAVQVTATVVSVDQRRRRVTLKNAAGQTRTISVGPEVQNLAQVRRGDQVVVTFYESVLFHLLPAGSAQPGVAAAEGADRAAPGQLPGAVAADAVTVIVTVVAVDKNAPSLTVKDPEGEVVTLPVREASRLDPVKVGDLLQITYSQALAIAVERP